MKNNFFLKPYKWAITFSITLTLFTSYVLLDAFVIPKEKVKLTAEISESPQGTGTLNSSKITSSGSDTSTISSESENTDAKALITNNSYKDENIQISIETVNKNGSTFYVADVQVSDPTYLKTALANDTFGKNVTQKTSEMAESNNAIFAINGDYYGFRDNGYVLRNGTLLRSSSFSDSSQALIIDSVGNLQIEYEKDINADELVQNGTRQVLSFGPALVIDGNVVDNTSKNALQSNPRTGIGQVSELHYIFIVVDGRSQESSGMNLNNFANEFLERGCKVAYNLDGGGSSTMWFNGSVINNPTDGKKDGERSVSDIVYIGE